MTGIWVFEEVDVLKLLCPHKFRRYKSLHKSKRFSKKDFIYFNNDEAEDIYLIERGKVKIAYYNDQGEEVIKAILGKGELFGEAAMFGETQRNEFAQSLDSRTSLCPVPVCKMQELMRENRNFSLKVYKFLGFRFKRLERRLDILLCRDTKERLEQFLKEMAIDYGYYCTKTGHTVIEHPYTQKDIANLIGTSRPTLNSLLNELKSEGMVDFTRKEIRLKVS